jgi:hypothetical protein
MALSILAVGAALGVLADPAALELLLTVIGWGRR